MRRDHQSRWGEVNIFNPRSPAEEVVKVGEGFFCFPRNGSWFSGIWWVKSESLEFLSMLGMIFPQVGASPAIFFCAGFRTTSQHHSQLTMWVTRALKERGHFWFTDCEGKVGWLVLRTLDVSLGASRPLRFPLKFCSRKRKRWKAPRFSPGYDGLNAGDEKSKRRDVCRRIGFLLNMLFSVLWSSDCWV